MISKKIITLFLIINAGCGYVTLQPWDDGIVAVHISRDFSDNMYDRIVHTMTYINGKTNVHVRLAHTSESRPVVRLIKSDEYNRSMCVGQPVMGGCDVYLIDRRDHYEDIDPVVLHELCHVIGLRHEHQRPDRDKYVKILKKNIIKKFMHNFDSLSGTDYLYDTDMLGYDYGSIMHYAPYAFSKCRECTTIQLPDGIDYVPARRLSDLDIKKINNIYPVGQESNTQGSMEPTDFIDTHKNNPEKH